MPAATRASRRDYRPRRRTRPILGLDAGAVGLRSLLLALAAFSSALLVQLLVWRVRRPKRQYLSLVALYLGMLPIAVAVVHLVALGEPSVVRLLPGSVFEHANAAMLYLALTVSFGVTYSAIQADSPTMMVLLRLDLGGPAGLTKEELLSRLTNDVLVASRLDDLVAGNLISLRDGRYVIGSRGDLIARACIGFRRLMRMERGG